MFVLSKDFGLAGFIVIVVSIVSDHCNMVLHRIGRFGFLDLDGLVKERFDVGSVRLYGSWFPNVG